MLKQTLVAELGYDQGNGLQSASSVNGRSGRAIPHVEQVYFVQNVPVAYFSQLQAHDPETLRKLHRAVWNESKVPLLYVILPEEIRVYNGYETPAEEAGTLDSEQRLLQRLAHLVDVETARRKIQQQLLKQQYDRLHLETGAFWAGAEGQRIHRSKRADQQLLKEMDAARRKLVALLADTDTHLAYALLGRSLFLRYLEDRKILAPDWIAVATDGQYANYLQVLADHKATYRIYTSLSQRFHGDMFPVTEQEAQRIDQRHLDVLRQFLRAEISGQLSFWPYDFNYIPIELISGIYDTFLSDGQQREQGAYYTPLPLVEVVLNETMPDAQVRSDMKILDPACGSGVFLVGAYQKLVQAWQREHGRPPDADRLKQLLKHNIFGVDISQEAVYIAAFSLYLAMLDFLSEEDIQQQKFRFPPLKGKNLLAADFFAAEVTETFADTTFDRIVGNPPWGRGTLKKEEPAGHWIKAQDLPTGDGQLVQAFLWRVPAFCATDGEIALLAPAKSTILLTSTTHQQFRTAFFAQYDVRALINFSVLRHELFPESLSPVVAIFYARNHPTRQKIVYGVPKPSEISQRLGAIVLDTTEVKYLERKQLLDQPALWKIALWGNTRDAALIEHLQTLPSLQRQATRLGWNISEGIQIGGGDKNYAPWLTGLPLVPTRNFRRYAVSMAICQQIKEEYFHRRRTPDIVQAPLVLIRQGSCEAAFVAAGSIAYRHNITGVTGKHGQERLLKWLVATVNSPLARYYHFLTSTRWGVERENILQKEYEAMPFLLPDENNPEFQQVLQHFDEIVALREKQDQNMLHASRYDEEIEQHQHAIDQLVFDIYDLTEVERQLVEDILKYGIEFFNWVTNKGRKPGTIDAVRPPSLEMLQTYAEVFRETTTALLRYQGQTMNATVYHDGAPLSVVCFEVVTTEQAREIERRTASEQLSETLRYLDRLLLQQHSPDLYMRRHVRIYDGAMVYLVRPAEQRFWSRSQARVDADSLLAEWLNRSRKEVGA